MCPCILDKFVKIPDVSLVHTINAQTSPPSHDHSPDFGALGLLGTCSSAMFRTSWMPVSTDNRRDPPMSST